jgi:hypothetical protein
MEEPAGTRLPMRPGFDSSLVGRRAECDGGGSVPGTHFAGREEFAGNLTGEYVDHGEPPWRWYVLADLSRKPPGYAPDVVWCESESLFLIDAEGRTLPDSLSRRRSEK